MKSKFSLLLFTALAVFCFDSLHAQSQESLSEFDPLYVTINTLHVVPNADLKDLQALEEEYYDKVTALNDLIVDHEILIEQSDSSVTSVKFIKTFMNWNDIENGEIVNEILIAQNWPLSSERRVFFEKQNEMYTNFHSDQIYLTTKFNKKLNEITEEGTSKLVRIDTAILADVEDESAYGNYESYVENVIYKNPLLKSYQPIRQYWGGDSREFIEIFILNSGVTFEEFDQKNKELFEKFIPNTVEREKFSKVIQGSVESQSTGFYKSISSLSK